MKVYVITHKKFKMPDKIDNTIYQPLLVGSSIGNKGLPTYLKDNIGDNISYKNKSYCELTGIYWIWKNSKEDIVGIDHYRRFFVDEHKSILSKSQISADLKKYDIILPDKDPYAFNGKSAGQFFCYNHDPLVWAKTRDIINEKYPTYVKDFDWYSNQYEGYSYNMFISSKKMIDEYNEWLFNILFELEKNVDLSQYTPYNKRMFGFVSERLLNVWVHHNNLNVKTYPVQKTEKDKFVTKIKNQIFLAIVKHHVKKRENKNLL